MLFRKDKKKRSGQTREDYQQNYQQDQEAAFYNAKYRDRLSKRMSTSREASLLNRLIGSQGRCRVLLDLPCGGGRLSPYMSPFTDLLIEADIGLGQLRYGREYSDVSTPQAWIMASGFDIPIKDASVDGTICVRLNHHLPDKAEREQLVRELLRVSGRFCVMSFFDHYSIKNTIRRLTRPFNGKPPKSTMKVGELERLARECGARLVTSPALFLIGSGHRYALMVKEQV